MSNKTLTLYEFDEFRVDTGQKCLWHADRSKDGKNLFYEKGVATNSVLLLRDVSTEK